jgi:hypothetical protein
LLQFVARDISEKPKTEKQQKKSTQTDYGASKTSIFSPGLSGISLKTGSGTKIEGFRPTPPHCVVFFWRFQTFRVFRMSFQGYGGSISGNSSALPFTHTAHSFASPFAKPVTEYYETNFLESYRLRRFDLENVVKHLEVLRNILITAKDTQQRDFVRNWTYRVMPRRSKRNLHRKEPFEMIAEGGSVEYNFMTATEINEAQYILIAQTNTVLDSVMAKFILGVQIYRALKSMGFCFFSGLYIK